MRWGPAKCFSQDDLYTTVFGSLVSKEIEEKFFGKIDNSGKSSVEYFANFTHPPRGGNKHFNDMLLYMSTQKLRTPKGLENLGNITQSDDRNQILYGMQKLSQMHCAIWTECVWCIADSSNSSTKFIISDHPVTVYNQECFPKSPYCRGSNDPDVRSTGTHVIFPLSLDKVLILTHLSWVRNPYSDALDLRPNPSLFRSAIFNFSNIQIDRMLSELEVNEINYIIKSRAFRYVAAACEDWLYPERIVSNRRWDKLGDGYLLMPDPRGVGFREKIMIGHKHGPPDVRDEYGRPPNDPNFSDRSRRNREYNTFSSFQGEFARKFGPERRGVSFQYGRVSDKMDTPELHEYHLSMEKKRPRKSRRSRRFRAPRR